MVSEVRFCPSAPLFRRKYNVFLDFPDIRQQPDCRARSRIGHTMTRNPVKRVAPSSNAMNGGPRRRPAPPRSPERSHLTDRGRALGHGNRVPCARQRRLFRKSHPAANRSPSSPWMKLHCLAPHLVAEPCIAASEPAISPRNSGRHSLCACLPGGLPVRCVPTAGSGPERAPRGRPRSPRDLPRAGHARP